MSDSQHSMITRSKQKMIDINPPPPQLPEEDTDEHGNVSDLIDYECDEEFDNGLFQKELNRLRGTKKVKPLHFSPKKKSRKKKNNPIGDLFLSYMLANLLNPKIDKRNRKKKKDLQENIIIDIIDDEEIDSESEIEQTSSEESQEEEELDEEDSNEEELDESEEELEELEESEEDESEESESEVEMDEYDEQYIDMEEEDLEDDDVEFTYFQNLEKDVKQKHLDSLKEIKEVRNTDVPLKFKILNSNMDIKTKTIAIGNIEKRACATL